MKSLLRAIAGSLVIIGSINATYAQRNLVTTIQKSNLESFSAQLSAIYNSNKQKAIALANTHHWPVRQLSATGKVLSLQGVNQLGFPVYLRTTNTEAAFATGTNAVQPGGQLGLNLSGSSAILQNKVAMWDGGTVLRSHQEFASKAITIQTGEAGSVDHSTHVAGTIFAQGVYAPAKGMAFGLTTLKSFDFDNDVSEMSNNAAGLIISNHSYGDVAGWDQNDDGSWIWYGIPGDNEDFLFGFYDDRAQAWDRIAYNAPYYLMVESAGNSHGLTGPPVGSTYYGYDSRTNPVIVNKGARPAGISSNDGYDVLTTTANAKNILTVGAVNQLASIPTTPADVRIASFSGWGPTDDGRIKPDIVGMGVNVVSTGAVNSAFYYISSGTSMSTPNVTGSLLLLQEYYAQMHHDSLMLAATLKGLVCHTAFDAGNAGPDYKYGWGLLDMRKAAAAITNSGNTSIIAEENIAQGETQKYIIKATGTEPLVATISWTDPEGTPVTYGTLNSRSPKLVNDLDLRIAGNGSITAPWVLNPTIPGNAAATGDNNLDNIEQVYITSAAVNGTYTLSVSHKGTLKNGAQKYSLIVTGGQLTTAQTATPKDGLAAYPVPANDFLNVSYSLEQDGNIMVQLIDMGGKIVYNNTDSAIKGEYSKYINVASLPSGTYVLRVSTSGQAASKKIIIVKSN